MWNFKGYLWNSTQNILPIHWKMWFLYNIEILRALRFKSSYSFLKRPPEISTVSWTQRQGWFLVNRNDDWNIFTRTTLNWALPSIGIHIAIYVQWLTKVLSVLLCLEIRLKNIRYQPKQHSLINDGIFGDSMATILNFRLWDIWVHLKCTSE